MQNAVQSAVLFCRSCVVHGFDNSLPPPFAPSRWGSSGTGVAPTLHGHTLLRAKPPKDGDAELQGTTAAQGRHVSPAASDSRFPASCWRFFLSALAQRTSAGFLSPLQGARKANPVKAGDAKLRGYRTPCVPRRSSCRTSRRRGYAWLRQELGNGRRGAWAARGVRTPTRSHSAAAGRPSRANRHVAPERHARSLPDTTVSRVRSHAGRRQRRRRRELERVWGHDHERRSLRRRHQRRHVSSDGNSAVGGNGSSRRNHCQYNGLW